MQYSNFTRIGQCAVNTRGLVGFSTAQISAALACYSETRHFRSLKIFFMSYFRRFPKFAGALRAPCSPTLPTNKRGYGQCKVIGSSQLPCACSDPTKSPCTPKSERSQPPATALASNSPAGHCTRHHDTPLRWGLPSRCTCLSQRPRQAQCNLEKSYSRAAEHVRNGGLQQRRF